MNEKRSYKRRKFFVKQWLQLRTMVILGGSTVAGGVIFGFIMKHTLKGKIHFEMYRPHSNIKTLWEILYPDVMRNTLILFTCSVIVLFLLLQFFSYRINRASGEVEDHVNKAMEVPGKGVEPARISIREFSDFGRDIDGLIYYYRNRWKAIADNSRSGRELCEALEADRLNGEKKASYVELLRQLESITKMVRREAEKRS